MENFRQDGTESNVSLPQQSVNLHPGLVVGEDTKLFVHCASICAVLNAAQYTICEQPQVLIFKDFPVSPVKAVLQLMRSILQSCGDSLVDDGSHFSDGGKSRN